MIYDIITQSLLFLPFSMGVFISYTLLKKADLTVDGTFVLGGAIFGLLVISGLSIYVALLLSMVTGFMTGSAVAFMQYKNGITPLISGIIALFILQSLNLVILGRPNLNLLSITAQLNLNFIPIISSLSFFALFVLLLSTLGLLLRAYGDNPFLLNIMGYNSELFRFIGLGLSNSLVALSGALTACYQGYVDISMGAGNVLIGIGTVIIGQKLLENTISHNELPFGLNLIGTILGTFIYFTLINFLIHFGLDPIYLKLTMGISIAALLLSNPLPEKKVFS